MFKYHSQSVTAVVVWQNVHHMAVIDRASVIFTVVFVLVWLHLLMFTGKSIYFNRNKQGRAKDFPT